LRVVKAVNVALTDFIARKGKVAWSAWLECPERRVRDTGRLERVVRGIGGGVKGAFVARDTSKAPHFTETPRAMS